MRISRRVFLTLRSMYPTETVAMQLRDKDFMLEANVSCHVVGRVAEYKYCEDSEAIKYKKFSSDREWKELRAPYANGMSVDQAIEELYGLDEWLDKTGATVAEKYPRSQREGWEFVQRAMNYLQWNPNPFSGF